MQGQNMTGWYTFGIALFAAIGTFLFVCRVYARPDGTAVSDE